MGIGALAVNYYNNQNVHYGLRGASERMETSFGDEIKKYRKGELWDSTKVYNIIEGQSIAIA